MACDYRAIRRENERRYGTDIGRIGPMLLADRYDDRTHFIFELLQNAEDAIARRPGWQGSRCVSFHLMGSALRVGHFGQPFEEPDVRGICGIAESTKDLTAIGRFGIGFKSVYAFTDRPEVHSGAEDFAIESFVWPAETPPVQRGTDETVIVLPLRVGDNTARDEITRGFRRLGPRTLLFLHQIEEIEWQVEGGPSGLYVRSEPEDQGENVKRICIIGETDGEPDVEETWLVFSCEATTAEGVAAGRVEIAFWMRQDKESGNWSVQPVTYSPLVVFFPTVLETHLGFLVQGPYRTTPSRDNVPRSDPWNQRLVGETASLLVVAMRWLRDHDLVDTGSLRCMPLDPTKFGETAMFEPLYRASKRALLSEPILPCHETGHVSAANARLARTHELRKLFSPAQLAALYGEKQGLSWLSGDITQDRTPEIRRYLIQELGIPEVTPETIIPRLDKAFLQSQSDDWILVLYHFLNGQQALLPRLSGLPLIRLEDGTHVVACLQGQAQAFLPATIKTGFPTVRASVCGTEDACHFLLSLGLTQPDPVDDVIRNVLPKYSAAGGNVSDTDYESDIRRILTASATDSKDRRERLLAGLRETAFVKAVAAYAGAKSISKPTGVYIATERLKDLFTGVADVLLVDDGHSCLRGEDVRELLEACGAVRYLRPIEDGSLSWDERKKLREQAGHAETSGQKDRVTDWMLSGLEKLIEALPSFDVELRRAKARLLWEELAFLEDRRGKGVFTGEYTWSHYGSYRTTFDAAFVRRLNEGAWVPDANGGLHPSEFVLFDSLGWKPNPFLQSKIRFRAPLMETLAKEAGLEPGLLDLLKRLGVTSEGELRKRLGIAEKSQQPEDKPGQDDVAAAIKTLLGDSAGPTSAVSAPSEPDTAGGGLGGRGSEGGTGTRVEGGMRPGSDVGSPSGRRVDGGKTSTRTPGGTGARPFVSYVALHPNEQDEDPDGLEQEARQKLENHAISLILAREPRWQRTPAMNPGFDLFEVGTSGYPMRWCEVKAMTGGLADRPVGLSHIQFEHARSHGEAYWLYVVERAGTEHAEIIRIQDPAGKARTFLFDRGWRSVAEGDQTGDDTEGEREEKA